MILDNTRAWGAIEYAHRLQASRSAAPREIPVTASAGVAEAIVFTDKDTLIHEADLALIATKRAGQHAAIYTPDMEPHITTAGAEEKEHYTQTLANALARAVDAKDSYTRSHSQTASQLCALMGRRTPARAGTPRPDEYALSELRRHAGTQFDPDIVDALIRSLARLTHPGTTGPHPTSAPPAA